MKEKIITKENLNKLIKDLSNNFDVFAPVDKKPRVVWGKITDFSQISEDYLNSKQTTILPPSKQFFLKSYDEILEFNAKHIEYKKISSNMKEFVIFGVHPWDLHGILLMDKVFLEGDYHDDIYAEKRHKSILIGLDAFPIEYNFSKSAGTDKIDKGFDLFLTPLNNERFLLKIGTEKGKSLLKNITLNEVDENAKKELNEFLAKKDSSFKRSVDMSDLPKLLDETYDSEIWEEWGKKCVGCTRCSIVCPTCYCHNVREDYFLDMERGVRIRTWDSCFRDGFALVAGGHNFRKKLSMRIRHRYYHKERIFSYEYGIPACVGCGRCSRDCIAGIKPDEVFNSLRKVVAK